MNLNLIKNEIEQFGVSYGYMAECCGVGETYLKQCLNGSKPMTKALLKKVKGVIKTLNINPKSQKFKEEQERKVIIKEKGFDKKQEPTINELREFYNKKPKVVYENPFREMLTSFGKDFGVSNHSVEFNDGKLHYIFKLDISEIDE